MGSSAPTESTAVTKPRPKRKSRPRKAAPKPRAGDTHAAAPSAFDRYVSRIAEQAGVAEAARRALVVVCRALAVVWPALKPHPELKEFFRQQLWAAIYAGGETAGRAAYQVPKGVQGQSDANARRKLVERGDAAVEDGRVVLVPGDGRPRTHVEVPEDCWPMLLQIFVPEEYEDPDPAAAPVDAPPGSPERVAEMSARYDRGEQVLHPGDATMVSLDGTRQAVMRQRKNGTGMQPLGWADGAAGG